MLLNLKTVLLTSWFVFFLVFLPSHAKALELKKRTTIIVVDGQICKNGKWIEVSK